MRVLSVLLLCVALLFGWGASVHAETLAETQAKAEQGDAKAQYLLGWWTLRDFRDDDIPTAIMWLSKSAEQGYLDAQLVLAVTYVSRQDVVLPNHVRAVAWLRKAAEQGNMWAQTGLGLFFSGRQSAEQDERRCNAWWRNAEDSGSSVGMLIISPLCESGWRVTPQDERESLVWYRKAAEQEEPLAQTLLGTAYAEGRGVEQDEVHAVTWYRKAAEKNFGDAQLLLGQMYANGRGVPRDSVQAYMWMHLGAQQLSYAAQQRDNLAQSLTSAQIAEGEQNALAWQEAHGIYPLRR